MKSPYLFDIEDHFKKCLADIGHPVDQISVDDGWKRYACPESRQSKTSARYCAHSDGVPVLKFQCMKCGIQHNFPYKNGSSTITPEERQKINQEAQKRKAEKLKKEAEERKAANFIMNGIVSHGRSFVDHPYFAKKNIELDDECLKIDEYCRIICPVHTIDNKLISIQTISEDGTKLFFKGTTTKNGFYSFGEFSANDDIYFCEGIATSITIRMVTKKTVVCVYGKHFDDISEILRAEFKNNNFYYCCDLPSSGEKITSQHNAEKAIQSSGGKFLLPDFSSIPNDLMPDIKRSDFNDLYCLLLKQGKTKEMALAELNRQIEKQIQDDDMNSAKKENIENFPFEIKKEDYPVRDGKRVLNNIENLTYLINRLNVTVKWNEMIRNRELKIPQAFTAGDENFDLTEIINYAETYYYPSSKIDLYLDNIAKENSYHPIVEAIKSKPWDGISRLNKFIKTVQTSNDELSHRLIKRWMISAVTAIFTKDDFQAQGVLVLCGKQDIGKTRWVLQLDPINCGAVMEGKSLDPHNKDHIHQCAKHWIVELGELDSTFKRADIARLKSFVTAKCDIVRLAYARKDSFFKRQTVFAATVNHTNYLIDETGNRRWWTIPVENIDLNHGLDIQQIWAEVYKLFLNGETHHLDDEEKSLLNIINQEHEQIDPIEEKFLEYFDWHENWQKHTTQSMTSTEVLAVLGYDNPNRAQATRMASIIIKYTKKKPTRRKHTLPIKKIIYK
jgi:putative DNA primase/helicase